MRETRLYGRGSELAFLHGLVEGVRAGAGAAVLVEGEQGIGKSALLRTGLAGADEAGITAWWGTAGKATGLARIERLFPAVDQLCAAGPVLLVAENLQWADEASVATWRRLSRTVSRLPLLLVGSARPGAGRDDLDRLRRDLVAHHGTVLAPPPLSADQVASLVRNLLGGRPGPQLAGVLSQAGGNPLYARELARALVHEGRVLVSGQVAELAGEPGRLPVPASLATVLRDRLCGLPPTVVAVLRLAALLGPEFAVSDLEVLTGLTVGELMGVIEAGAAAGVLTDAGLHLGFRHELIRQLLYDEKSGAGRAAAHLETARRLAVAGAPPERVAAQLVIALSPEPGAGARADADRDWVSQWLADTAAQLTHRAPRVAAELVRAVLRQLPEADPRRGRLEASLAAVAFLLMRDDEVEQVWAWVLERRGDPELMAEVACLVAFARLRNGRTAEAGTAVDEALPASGVSEPRRARLRALRALVLVGRRDFDAAAIAAAAALEQAQRAGDRLGAGYALHALSKADPARPDRPRRLGYIDRALLVTADDPQTADLRVALLGDKASELALMGRQAEAIGAAQQALALAAQAGTPRLRVIRAILSQLYYEAGRWDEALAEPRSALAGRAADVVDYQAGAIRALVLARRDDWAAAVDCLGDLPEAPPGGAPSWPAPHSLLLARALAAERAGEPGAAVAILRQCLEAGPADRPPGRHQLLPTLVRLALAAGDSGAAAVAAGAASGDAAADRAPVTAAVADHCRGLVSGDPEPALAAARYFGAAARPLERAQALEDAAVLAAICGGMPAARQALTAAVAAYELVGAQWDARRAVDRLRPYGVRPGPTGDRRRPATGWGALTRAELKIAYLVADGQSNPDIAAELYLSRNTVQTHVSHILAKLSARTRADIVSEAARHPPAGLARR